MPFVTVYTLEAKAAQSGNSYGSRSDAQNANDMAITTTRELLISPKTVSGSMMFAGGVEATIGSSSALQISLTEASASTAICRDIQYGTGTANTSSSNVTNLARCIRRTNIPILLLMIFRPGNLRQLLHLHRRENGHPILMVGSQPTARAPTSTTTDDVQNSGTLQKEGGKIGTRPLRDVVDPHLEHLPHKQIVPRLDLALANQPSRKHSTAYAVARTAMPPLTNLHPHRQTSCGQMTLSSISHKITRPWPTTTHQPLNLRSFVFIN